jgi:hypothetical protein
MYKKMLPDFFGVATGSWLRRIEQFGSKNFGRPRLDYEL